jgi:hypothetical protein
VAVGGSNSSAGTGGAGASGNRSLKGNYSCVLQGVNILPTGEKLNIHALATFRANGKGKITASKKVAIVASKDGTYATCNYQLSVGTYDISASGSSGDGDLGAGSGSWNLEYTGEADNDAQHCLGTKENSSLLIAAHGKKVYITPVLGSELILGGTCEAQ